MFAAWAPLRHHTYRSLWLAQFTSNVGGFMQVVGAVWLMGTLGGTPALVALVQTAMSTPTLFFSIPAGAIADLVDRRKLILAMQVGMLCLALSLAAITHYGLVTPTLLLAITFALSTGMALNTPAWSALQPELVPKEDFPQALTLQAASQNLARVVGPALGGLVLAFTGPEAVFTLNALSYIGVVVVLLRTPQIRGTRSGDRERLIPAVISGARYARYARSLRGTLIRCVALTVPASATMALLPVVARDELGLDSRGYGLLLACYGLGAVSGSFALPTLRRRIGTDRTVMLGIAALSVNLVSLALMRTEIVVAALLIVGGFGWICSLSTLMVAAQTALPAWVRARGIGFFFLAFQGGVGVGSAIHGFVADRGSLALAYGVAVIALIAGWLVTRRFTLARIDQLELQPATGLVEIPEPLGGATDEPIVITVEYQVDAPRRDEFVETMRRVERMRRRVGALSWSLDRDVVDPARFRETYRAPSWLDYRRSRSRMTVSDQKIEEAVAPFAVARGVDAYAREAILPS